MLLDVFDNIQIADDSERIILLRRRMDMSQYQFAEEIGISSSYLGQIERKILPVSPQLKKKINLFLTREKELYGQDIYSSL